MNAGAVASSGPVRIRDTLPEGVTAGTIELFATPPGANPGGNLVGEGATCTVTTLVRCELSAEESAVAADGALQMIVYVTVDEPEVPGPLTNAAAVSGGNEPEVTHTSENQMSPAPAAFGPSNFEF